MANYYTHIGKRRILDEYIIPGYLALGDVLSSDSGKVMFRLLYEERRELLRHEENKNLAYRDYPTRRQEFCAENYAGSYARVATYRNCLAYLMADSGHGITQDTACRIINVELAEMLASDSDDDFYNAGIRKDLNRLCSVAFHNLTTR